MGITMQQSSSPAASIGNDEDANLPDAPPLSSANNADTANISLEAMFNDEGSEDELSSSSSSSEVATSSDVQPAAPVLNTAGVQSESYSEPETMHQFYARLFPFRALFQWLNHSIKPGTDFANREFALVLSSGAYLRYQSFLTADTLRKDIIKHIPTRFEIGPVYTTNPRDRKSLPKSSMFKPLSKEIVFDIDLTDYDDIRTCCEKANICSKCWAFATMAIKVMDIALREDFGFEHILWVYSGRRGIHAWISDKHARELDDNARKALTGYFEILAGRGAKKVNLRRPLHPHAQRSLEILKPYFQKSILVDQEPFLSEQGEDKLLQMLPDKALNEALKRKWASSPGRPSARKWADIDALAATGVSKTLQTKDLMNAKQDILLEYTYPRLDVAVAQKRNHLLKSPFVVHPGTGRVCVPIMAGGDLKLADDFDPFQVPKVTDLLKEIDQYNPQSETSTDASQDRDVVRKLSDWERTSLKPYVELFESHVRGILKDETARVKREREEDGTSGPDGMEF